jgi:hypothetical protein
MQNIYGWLIFAAVVIVLIALLLRRGRKTPGYRLRLAFFLNNIKIEGNNMALTMDNTQQSTGKLKPVNLQGEPASVVAGSVDYFMDDPELADVVENPDDETELTVVSKSKTGVGTLTVKAKTLDGEGNEVDIEATVAIEIVPAGAVGFAIEFAPPVQTP